MTVNWNELPRMKRLLATAVSALRGRSDEETMWRVKMSGDPQEFARLVSRWEGPIWRLCTRLTGDPARGEELKQETFLRLFQSRNEYQPSARFSTLLWRIALNLCRDEFRRQERRRQFFGASGNAAIDDCEAAGEPVSEAPGPDATVVRLEEGELVRQAVLRLPEIYRTVIVLRHYEDLKLAQIAEILQVPEGTVNSRMAEALTRLSRALAPKLKPAPAAPVPIPAVLNTPKSAVL